MERAIRTGSWDCQTTVEFDLTTTARLPSVHPDNSCVPEWWQKRLSRLLLLLMNIKYSEI